MKEYPPKETWEAGIQEAEKTAELVIDTWEKENKAVKLDVLTPTEREIKLSVSFLVMRRQVHELRADLIHAAMVGGKLREKFSKQSGSEKYASDIKMLAEIEGRGRRIASAWITIDNHITAWCKPEYWFGKRPFAEAQRLKAIITGKL
jgi:hypothetical protein